MLNFYINKLQEKLENHTYRQLSISDSISAIILRKNRSKLISFSCNDYFGLAHNAKAKKLAIKAIKKYGVGARSSRFITGNNSFYQKLEKNIARLKNTESSLVFSSGYSLAIGVIPALVGRNDLIIADKLIHSSLLDGAKLSMAKLLRFKHNDIHDATKILLQNRGNYEKCIIITETVFSMDGDLGKINDLLQLAINNNAYLVSDAAHDLFINPTINHPNHIQMGTLSKAFGTLGGYVAASSDMIKYFKNYAKSVIYSTALPPSILAASNFSCEYIRKKQPGKKTLENANYFLQYIHNNITPNLISLFPHQTHSAIIPVIIGDDEKVVKIANHIQQFGFLVSPIRYPTVPKNSARLRITFSSQHSQKQIEEFANVLIKTLK